MKTKANNPAPETGRPASLVGRLIRGAVLWALPLLAVTAFALVWLYRVSTYQIFDEPLISTVTSLISSAETIPQESGQTIIALSQEPLDPRYQRALSGRYWQVISDDAQITSRSLFGEEIEFSAEERARLINKPGAQISGSSPGPDGESLRFVARSVILPDIESPVIMTAAMDQSPARRAIGRFAVLAISVLAALTLGLIAAVTLQVRLGLRPLFDLRDRVADVRIGGATRVEGDYPREIAPLAGELNSLITHNRDVVERARTHVSNLAHALKTPLAVLTNEADKDKTELGSIVGRQTRTMTSQVEHHLARARAAARAQTIGTRSDISASITAMSRTLARIYGQKDLDITQNLNSDIWFRGEKADLDEIAGNLLDNACKWAKAAVRITVAPGGEAGTATVIVEDDGPGVKPENYGKALQRGERLDEAMPGTGFGLSIVDDLVRAYKGSVVLGRSDLGGLKVTLNIPSAPPPDGETE